MLNWMASWPRWGWYVASVASVLPFALLSAGIYAAVNGPFVEPLLWSLAGIPVLLLRTWWFFRRRDQREAKASSAIHSPTT